MGATKAEQKARFYGDSGDSNNNFGEGTEYLVASNNNNLTMLNNNPIEMNNIGDFYAEKNVFITGATGFVGKALLEKILRSCERVNSVYIMIRTKRGMSSDSRLKELLKSPIFEKIREKTPEYFDKIKVVSGDVTQPNLGLSDADRNSLIDNVHILFHSAATVRFTEVLKDAVMMNTLGTQRVMELCKEMKKLKSFVHVSTAYSNADKREVDEMVYNPPYDPQSIINCIENLAPDAVNVLTEKLIGKHPNTYTLTKAMAEAIVQENSSKIPSCIVRPSIITGAWKEPYPGWVDNVSGITGIMMEIGRGTIRSIICDEKCIMDLIPVDVVASTLITAAWHTAAYSTNEMRVYNCTSGGVNPVSWKHYGEMTKKYAIEYPSKYLCWYPGFTYRTNKFMHWICYTFLHALPACFLDVLMWCTNRKPIMYRICKKFRRAAESGTFFAINEWKFGTNTLRSLHEAVDLAEDGANFNINMSPSKGFEWDPFVKNYMLGIRQYVLKDDMSTLTQAKAKLSRLYWAHKVFQVTALYLAFRLAIQR